MNIYDDFSKPIEYTRNGIISIGTFEALHLGHQKLLLNMLNVAKEKNLESYVLTFIESPKKINNEKNILELSDKLSMIEQLGIQHVILCNFNIIFRYIITFEVSHSYKWFFIINTFIDNLCRCMLVNRKM